MLRALRLVQAVPGAAAATRAALGAAPLRRRWARVRDALALPASPASAYMTRRGLFSPEEVKELVSPPVWREGVEGFNPVQHVSERADGSGGTDTFGTRPVEWISRAELRTYTHHQLLRDTDVMSMAHSLEVRVPLLDVELVETVLRLPTVHKTNGLPGPKPLLTRAAGDRLPAVVRQRREKRGFTFPLDLWLKEPLRAQARSMVDRLEGRSWMRRAAVRQVLADYDAGRLHWSRLWALVALGAIR
jgi:asparagine synthase (glutamine-hydrolysing)